MLGMDIYEKKFEDKFVKVIKDGYGVEFVFLILLKIIDIKIDFICFW